MIFGQLEMAATTNEVVDNGDFPRVVENINIANITAGALTFRLWVVKFDQTLANKHAYSFGKSIAANDEKNFSDDIPLELGDKIWVWGSATGLVASVFGQRAG
jgi:hypothetical protein